LLKVENIGRIKLDLPPNTPKGSPIEITMICSAKGLDIKARNPQTNQIVETEIVSETLYTDEQVEEARNRIASIQTSGQI
jgi:hypothetical protein